MIYKTKSGLYSKNRFSNVIAISYFEYSKLTEDEKYKVRDFKTHRLYLIEFISSGRWKFLNKHFNKLDDINNVKAKLIKNFCRRKNNCTNKSTNYERGILWVQGQI